MKHFMSYLYIYVFICLITSCSTYLADSHSYGTQVRPITKLTQAELNDEQTLHKTWDRLLQNSMIAQVNGIGNYMRVRIPLLSQSFIDEPLFVVNGHNIGKGFAYISHIDPNSVQQIQILRRPNEISFYGNQGRHGVIIIKTI